jgi:hypothetical protein
MYTLCWSAKGGSGTTVVACALATTSARRRPTILIDLGGDAPAALGVSAPTGPGVGDWLASPYATPDALAHLAVEVAPDLHLVPAGGVEFGELDEVQAERLAHACADGALPVVVDAGRHAHHDVLHRGAERSLIVVRPCYLALRRAVQRPGLATAAVVVHEPGRALGVSDVERALGVRVVAEVPWDPGIARAVDAGLLSTRLPGALQKALGRMAEAPAR